MAVEGVLIQPLNSENPGCTQANQGCGEQHPAHQLKPLREWRSHGLSVEWVVPKGWFIKFFQQRVGFQFLASQQQLNHLIPDESSQAFCLLSLMPGLELDRRHITCVVVKS